MGKEKIVKAKKLGTAQVLLAVLLATSLIVLVASAAMIFYSQASLVVTVLTLVLGGSLLAWHVRLLISGSGRTRPTITTNLPIALIVVGCFAAITGFGLFEVLGGRIEPIRIVLALAGAIGLVASLIALIRDAGEEEADEETEDSGEGTDVAGEGTDVPGEGTDVAGEGTDVPGEGTDAMGEAAAPLETTPETIAVESSATPEQSTELIEQAPVADEVPSVPVAEPVDDAVLLYETPGPQVVARPEADDISAAEMTMIVPPPSPRARRAAENLDDLTWLYEDPEAAEAEEEKPARARRGI